jgi:hypothetical protein
MPRFTPSVVINDCYGSVGDVTFFHWKGGCYYKNRTRLVFAGTDAQLAQLDVHRRALAAWRTLDHDVQGEWHQLAKTVEPHRPPFDNSTHITGHNLFVSAYHGFARLGNEHVPEPRAFEMFPPFAVEVGGASVVEGLLVLPVSVFIAAAFVPERYRLLAKIQLTQPGKGRNPGKMRNALADRPCGSSSVNLFIDPSIWGLNLQQYQVHSRFILLDTVTGYRSQYHQQSFLIGL